VKRNTFRRVAAPGIAALALGLGLTACAAGNEEPAAGDSGATVEGLSGTLNGAGSSAQEAAQGAWQSGFQTANTEVTVNYDPVGSGGGREQFISGGVDFAGSDSYLSDEEGELSGAKKRCLNEDPIEIPNYVSPIAVVYNVEGVDNLQLSGPVIADIFNGKITKWNDKKIAADNPGTKLPAETITPVHRADDSGTTENFTEYLSEAGEGAWPHEPDGVWPVKSGEAAQGTSGVVAAVENGSGTIGYADESQAGDLGIAKVKVGEQYVAPTAEAAAKILEVSPRVEGRSDVDMAFDLDRKTTESGAYPVVLTSYLLACQTYDDKATADLVKGYLSYVISDEGQDAAAKTAGSAPLPASLQDEAEGIVEKIKAKG
jgi:phosphate transport system substrate-binding protein